MKNFVLKAKSTQLVFRLVLWICFGWILSSRQCYGGELADAATAAHQATLESIRAYSAQIEMGFNIKDGKPAVSQVALYWKTPEFVRIVQDSGTSGVADLLYKRDRIEILTKNPNGIPSQMAGLRIEPIHQRMTELDAWVLSLFSFPVGVTSDPPVTPYGLIELHRSAELISEHWEEIDGRRHLQLDYKLDVPERRSRSYKVWLDPVKNWLVDRCEHSIQVEPTKKPWISMHTVGDFIEVAPRILVPTVSTTTTEVEIHGLITQIAHLADVRVNGSVPTPPRMPMPVAGAMVFDKVSGTTYQVDQYHRKRGKSYRIGAPAVVAMKSTTEPKPVTRYYLWATALTLIGAGLLTLTLRRTMLWRSMRKEIP